MAEGLGERDNVHADREQVARERVAQIMEAHPANARSAQRWTQARVQEVRAPHGQTSSIRADQLMLTLRASQARAEGCGSAFLRMEGRAQDKLGY